MTGLVSASGGQATPTWLGLTPVPDRMTWTGPAAGRKAAERTAPRQAPATAGPGSAGTRVIDPARLAAYPPHA
jgi:hypothetical protein